MHIAGHIGFTLGLSQVLGVREAPFSRKRLAAVAAVALLPDVFDRAIHLLIPSYPLHGIFHSIPLYVLLFIAVSAAYKQMMIYPVLAAFSAALDLFNVNPESLLYPFYSEASTAHLPVVRTRIEGFMSSLPGIMGYRFPSGHYLLFEAAGLLIILLILRNAGKERSDETRRISGAKGERIRNIFLSVVSPAGLTRCPELDVGDVSALTDMALRHNLAALLYARLTRRAGEDAPCAVPPLEDLKRRYAGSALRSVKQEATEKRVQALLRKGGLESLVIRGNAIARDLYDDPNCRTSADVDILVRQRDVFSADAILRDAGFEPCERMPVTYCLYRIHHAEYLDRQTNTHIEAHWLFGVPGFFALTSDDIWALVVPADSGGMKLSSEMQLVMLLIHHHSHSFRELKILIDIYWTLHAHDASVDWQACAGRLVSRGLGRTTLIALKQIESLWPDAPGTAASVRLLKQSLEGRGWRAPQFLLTYFRMDPEGSAPRRIYRDKLVARLALDRWSAIACSYARTLFPPREAIRGLYADRRMWVLPLHYLRFVAWRVKAWIGSG